ncbi:MAM and LDL-receptor class A domain-containing protein 1-like isoform X1 [Dreissena polymorpha]|uniref:MAM and LDL-receptor class A domain-containing protein 1-like isoform X1 n=1 Tax=Dreissena polymorpha TaxID=45954 RepID=UPI00226514D9|nr:MAM and LDL-receptor class A domain-containing protein 1-like isoform X1 [Dreissena polymorpha]
MICDDAVSASSKMRQFLAVLIFSGCLNNGASGTTYCTVDDDTPVFSAPDLGSRVVTLVERNTCFHGDMKGEWLFLQDTPIYYIHGYTVIEDTEPAADKNEANGFREYDPRNKQNVRSRCVDVEGINTCASARSIPNHRQEKRFLMGDATWTQWIEWSECNTAVCNIEGTRNRTRLCFVLNPNVQANCNGGDSIQLQKCTKPCLVDGSWGAWEGWSVCYCNGFRPRYRKCDSPPPLNGGHVCNGSEFEVGMCNRTSNTNCPVNGKWTDWSAWSTCSVSCENGTQSRNRYCTNPPPAYGGKDCGLDDSAFQNCSTSIPCPDQITCTFDAPLNCTWHNVDLFDNMDWIVFNGSTNTDDTGPSSDHTFGNSTGKYIYLESSAPSEECDKAWYQSGIIQPGFNAPVCVQFWYHMYGADIGSLNIYMATGPKLPGKLLWTVSGNQGDVWKSGHVPLSYTSNISIIAEATVGNGFHGDIGLDDLMFTQSTCFLYPSMANAQWAATCPTTTISPGHWSPWFNGQCSVTCGNGTLTRMRHCSSGHTDDCAGTSSEVIGCQKPPCGVWSEWFLGDCSVTCGDGTLSRMRICSSGHDEDCPGSAFDAMRCSQGPC